MPLAVGGTLNTNKQKKTIKTRFPHEVLGNNKLGNGFWVNLNESEAPKPVPGIRKKKHVMVVSYGTKSIK